MAHINFEYAAPITGKFCQICNVRQKGFFWLIVEGRRDNALLAECRFGASLFNSHHTLEFWYIYKYLGSFITVSLKC